nr:GNAT family N-acetyltransferase [Sporolactobacillus kofuensis]
MTSREVYEIFQARESVFVVEQECPYHEIDEHDLESLHVYTTDDSGRITAYARIFKESETVTFGRVLVRQNDRGSGLGRALITKVMEVIEQKMPHFPIVIEAQEYIQPLYAQFGFIKTSEPFLLDNIPHVRMEKNKL